MKVIVTVLIIAITIAVGYFALSHKPDAAGDEEGSGVLNQRRLITENTFHNNQRNNRINMTNGRNTHRMKQMEQTQVPQFEVIADYQPDTTDYRDLPNAVTSFNREDLKDVHIHCFKLGPDRFKAFYKD